MKTPAREPSKKKLKTFWVSCYIPLADKCRTVSVYLSSQEAYAERFASRQDPAIHFAILPIEAKTNKQAADIAHSKVWVLESYPYAR